MTGFASVDKPWCKYYTDNAVNAAIPEWSMVQYMMNCNAGRLKDYAIEMRSSSNDFGKGIALTYGQYFSHIRKNASAFRKLGTSVGENVGMILPNIFESRISIYGLNMVGAVSCPLSFMLSVNDLKKKIDEYDISTILVYSQFYEKYKEVLETSDRLKHIIFVCGYESFPFIAKCLMRKKMKPKSMPSFHKVLSYEDFYLKGDGACEPYFEKGRTAVIVGTSGTTGTPKGVCLTNENINAIAIQHLGTKTFLERETILDILIQSIGYGISAMHFAHCGGMRCIMVPELITDKFGHVIDIIRPDHICGGPVHAQSYYNSPEFARKGEIKLKNFACGGASLGKKLEELLNSVSEGYCENGSKNDDIIVRQGFGATENGGCGTYQIFGQYKFGGVGVPLPLDVFSIFDYDTGDELPYNSIGEICISGPTVMSGYYNNPEETGKVLKTHPDGSTWLHLSDTGYIDEDGQVFHIDRIKNIFMRIGFNVHPAKVADSIKSLPFVSDCAVLGYDHPEQQMVPVAFVKLKDECNLTEANALSRIDEFCVMNLEETSVPARYVLVDSIPYNLGGKIDGNRLKKAYPISF